MEVKTFYGLFKIQPQSNPNPLYLTLNNNYALNPNHYELASATDTLFKDEVDAKLAMHTLPPMSMCVILPVYVTI
jgi:hypothetical protein